MADDPKKHDKELPGPTGLLGLAAKPFEALASKRQHTNRTRGAAAGGMVGGALGSFLGLVGAAVGGALGAVLGGWFGATRDGDAAGDVLVDNGTKDEHVA